MKRNPPRQSALPAAFTVEDAAAELDVTPQRVRQLIGQLNINALRIGKRTFLLSAVDIEKMRERKTQRGPEAKKASKK